MRSRFDFACEICGTLSLKGEECGYIHHVNTYKACILCTKTAEEMCIEVSV